jgi:hypothetical protein
MHTIRLLLGIFGVFFLLNASNLQAAPEPAVNDPLAERVRKAIDRGIDFLKKKQEDRGAGQVNWENDAKILGIFPGGASNMALLALLTAGVKPTDPAVQRVLPYIRSLPPQHTYVVGIQTLIFNEVNDPKDRDQVQKNVDWLLRARVIREGKLWGWGYTDAASNPDNSNSQYALLGLWAGKQYGAKIDKKAWEQIQEFYMRTQVISEKARIGGWGYHPVSGNANGNRNLPEMATGSVISMTVAGVCGLIISGQEVNSSQQQLDPKTGVAKNCGFYPDDDAVNLGLRWIGRNFTFRNAGHTFYNVYGLERVGRLSGQRFIGDHDWYREGCESLVGLKKSDLNQRQDGSWGMNGGGVDNNEIVSTAFALLFLSKGRTPILISKLAYDAPQRQKNEWNRKHNDTRNLVEYASRELFKKTPLAWQVFDPRAADLSDARVFNEELASMLQSPILYMNGHKRPELSDQQVELLKRYIDEGGFIFAEACCGSEEFREGFQDLVKQMYPDSALRNLPPDHPVWTANALIKPGEFPELMGVERGCKTIMIFSPHPLAGFWEEKRFAPEPGRVAIDRSQLAYRLGGNVIAYATGMELPKPRLTQVKVVAKSDERNLPRHFIKVAQLKHDGNMRPANQAIRNLAQNLRDKYRFDVAMEIETVRMNEDALSSHRVLYMHGRDRFTADPEDLANLRFHLQTGGMLLADACCGKKEFDQSFRDFAAKLFPDAKLERISTDVEQEYLFSAKLNGQAITEVRCRVEKADGTPEPEYKPMAPILEGIKVDGRWVVIYSRYDLGCALEKSKSISCLGYDHESALQIASAAILYALKK